MKGKLSFLRSQLENLLESSTSFIFTGVAEKYVYLEGKKTDVLESVVLTTIADGLGEVNIIFPAKNGLADQIDSMFNFGQPFFINELEAFGTVEDVKISIYNNSLTFKVHMKVV